MTPTGRISVALLFGEQPNPRVYNQSIDCVYSLLWFMYVVDSN